MAPRTRLLLPAALLLLSSAAFAEPARLEQARQALRERSFAKAQELASEELRANPQADEALYLRALAQFHQQRLSALIDKRGWISNTFRLPSRVPGLCFGLRAAG